MRLPSSIHESLAWHRAALRGLAKIDYHAPHPGWFKRRLTRGGPFVPACIFIEQEIDAETGELLDDERLICELSGERVEIGDEWPRLADHPITAAEFGYLTAIRLHAAWHDPEAPEANPRRPIDWRNLAPPEF